MAARNLSIAPRLDTQPEARPSLRVAAGAPTALPESNYQGPSSGVFRVSLPAARLAQGSRISLLGAPGAWTEAVARLGETHLVSEVADDETLLDADVIVASVSDMVDLAAVRVACERMGTLRIPVVCMLLSSDAALRVSTLRAGAWALCQNECELVEVVGTLSSIRRQARELERETARLKLAHAARESAATYLIHDLKGPLAVIMSALDLIQCSIESDDKTGALETIEDGKRGGARLTSLITGFMDIAKAEDGQLKAKKQSTDITKLVDDVRSEHAVLLQSRRIELTTTCSVMDNVEIDPDLVRRALGNLLENAFRYTPVSGKVAVRVVASALGYVEIRVANEGPAVPQQLRPTIFDKYSQGGSARTSRGIGLCFCRHAAEAHGGRISLVDEPGFGTCFRMELPISA